MRRFFSIILLLGSFTGGLKCVVAQENRQNQDTSKQFSLKVWPKIPLIEKDQFGQYLNFDIVVKNVSNQAVELSEIEICVIDRLGKLALRKSLNQNGQTPSIGLIGKTIIQPGQSLNIFNPFYNLPPNLSIGSLKYKFFFNDADEKEQQVINKERLPIDFDMSFIDVIKPNLYLAKTKLYLPLKGKLIVWDGHDFYSHHRRFPVGLPQQQEKGIIANSNRYAYDFINIDAEGKMFRNSPFKKTNWFVFGKPVFAPGSGRIIEVQNEIPDNDYKDKKVQSPDIPEEMDPLGMGNHVVIDHGNGEYSVILHMEKGSIKCKVGSWIQAGQQIGNVGFSGDAIYPHVHFTVMNGPKEQVNEGVPSYFCKYHFFDTGRMIHVKKGRIDSGEIIESDMK